MKKMYYALLMLLFMPAIVNAKTITCTSESDYTSGENVYDGINVTCSEGDVEIFAVEETSNELTWTPVVNPYAAVNGKKYAIDFVWTGTIDNSVDTMMVDGEDETELAVSCDTGCHLYSKTLEAKPATNSNTGTEKDIAVGTIYYVGDRIKFNDILVILHADAEDYFLEVDEGSYVLPTPQFTQDDEHSLWEFKNFLKEYDETDLDGLRFGYNTNVSSDKEPIGVKVTGGNGTVDNPFTFEPVYENASYSAEYTIIQGANQTYTKGSNTTILIKASGPLSKLTAIEIDNGNVINPSNYVLVEGSTELTLKSSFLENSSVGEHTITFKYNDGEVSTKLTIVEAAVSSNSNSENNTKNPATGDNIMTYILMLGISVVGLAVFGLCLNKRKNY